MPVQATVFSRPLQRLPWAAFDRAAAEHRMDAGHRGLDARSHPVALVAGQVGGAHGLRDIGAVLAAHAPGLTRQPIEPARRSTPAEADGGRSPAASGALIPALPARGCRRPRRAERARGCGRSVRRWFFPAAARGDGPTARTAGPPPGCTSSTAPGRGCPHLPRAERGQRRRHHDGQGGDARRSGGATYVFDLGYYGFGFWAAPDGAGRRSVTRPERGPVAVLSERPAGAAGGRGRRHRRRPGRPPAPARRARGRKNPRAGAGRMIVLTLDAGKQLRLFTDDLDGPAGVITELHETRRQIALFFRWTKQDLRIGHVHGRSEDAVRLQAAAAIITYLLLKPIHAAARTKEATAVFFATPRHALFHRIDIATLVGRVERRRASPTPTPEPRSELAP